MADRGFRSFDFNAQAGDLRADMMVLAARWLLTQKELRLLLGMDTTCALKWQPTELHGTARGRARRLVDLARYLSRLVDDDAAIVSWVHAAPSPGCGRSTLELLADPGSMYSLHHLLSLCAARRLHEETSVES